MNDRSATRPRLWLRRAVFAAATALLAALLALAALQLAERRLSARPVDGPTLSLFTGSDWDPITTDSPLPRAAVLLIHGLDEPGDIWDDLAPALAEAGHAVIRFDYPNDQPIGRSALALDAALTTMANAGVHRLDLVGHSMGGLVAREVLTRADPDPAPRPAVPTLVMVGTPNAGSPWAPLRPIAEVRDRAQQLVEGAMTFGEAIDLASDGAGEAAHDLLPGSPFLTELNARPHPDGVRLVCIVGRWSPDWANGSLAADALGDGVVPIDSASLPGAHETIEVRGNHRSMLLRMPLMGEPEAVSHILRTLSSRPHSFLR